MTRNICKNLLTTQGYETTKHHIIKFHDTRMVYLVNLNGNLNLNFTFKFGPQNIELIFQTGI